jgi:hypothetical protein
MTTNLRGHSDYWSTPGSEKSLWDEKYPQEESNEGLLNHARVVTGDYRGIRLEWGTAPK